MKTRSIFLGIILAIGTLTSRAQLKDTVLTPSLDTYVAEPSPNYTGESAATLATGYDGQGPYYSVFYFPISQLPSGAVITKADLVLELTSTPSPEISDGDVMLKYITESWNGSLDYDDFLTLGKSSMRNISVKADEYSNRTFTIDLREWTQRWRRGDMTNHGFAIYASDFFYIYSSESSSKPRLEVEYFIPDETIEVDRNVTISSTSGTNTNPGSLEIMEFTYYSSNYSTRSILDFDYSEINSDSTYMVFLELFGDGHATSTDGFYVAPITESWSTSTISWSNRPDCSISEQQTGEVPRHAFQDYIFDFSDVFTSYGENDFSSLHGFELSKVGNNTQPYFFTSKSDSQKPMIHVVYKSTSVDTLSVDYRKSYSAPVLGSNTRNTSPHSAENYIWEISPTVAVSNISSLSQKSQVDEKITYFDGLGRPMQEISIGGSPNAKDLIRPIIYDPYGRELRQYLSYEATTDAGGFHDYSTSGDDALGDQESFYQDHLGIGSSDPYAYSRTVYESSPLNRVLEQGTPGALYQPYEENDNLSEEHTVLHDYATNPASEIVIWEVSSNQIVRDGYYAAGELYVNTRLDPDDHLTAEYKDKLGRVILNVSKLSSTDSLMTYYVYDDFSLLRSVLPPMLTDTLLESGISTFNVDSYTPFQDYAYWYKYDGRKRMTMKKLPGSDSILMVYDNRDRLVLSQDGNMREDDKWMFSKYDNLNRPLITGTYSTALSRDQLASAISTFYNGPTAKYYEVYNENAGDFHYSNLSYPYATESAYLTVSYYDNYDAVDTEANGGVFSGVFNSTPPTGCQSLVKGQLTGSMTRVIGEDEWIRNVSYYDAKYRPIQQVSSLYPSPGSNYAVTDNYYDFVGKLDSISTANHMSTETNTAKHVIEYDYAGRVVETYLTINNEDPVLISQNEYNSIGELETKNFHSPTKTNFLQGVDYAYNLQGWLTGINDPEDLETEDDVFGLELLYNAEDTDIGNSGLFNGNISGAIWNTASTNHIQGYAYNYDNINRIEGADYSHAFDAVWKDTTGQDVGRISYDLNGNIDSLSRNDNAGENLDDLVYEYDGNKISSVEDKSYNTLGFYNGDSVAVEYSYDLNGNMVKDLNKGLDTIIYNHLNLPHYIVSGSDSMEYVYDATGNKWAKYYHKNSPEVLTKTYYNGSFVYEQGTGIELDYILFEEGLISMTGSTPEYNYYLKDHLGNTRVILNGDGDIQQLQDYYPFGMQFMGQLNGSIKYLYNGKELQDEQLGGINLDWYDYGARFYDPALGRWHVLDALASDQMQIDKSPYSYSWNSPINITDPDGNCPWCIGAIVGAAVDYAAQVALNYATGADNPLTNVDGKSILISAGAGALTSGASALVGTGSKTAIQVGLKMTTEMAIDAGESVVQQMNDNLDADEPIMDISGGEVITSVVVGKFAKAIPTKSIDTKPLSKRLNRAGRVAGKKPRASRSEAVSEAKSNVNKANIKNQVSSQGPSGAVNKAVNTTVSSILEEPSGSSVTYTTPQTGFAEPDATLLKPPLIPIK